MKYIKIKKIARNSWILNFSNWIFAYQKFKHLLNIVIKKGWGIRPDETLATLCFFKTIWKLKEGANFYLILVLLIFSVKAYKR